MVDDLLEFEDCARVYFMVEKYANLKFDNHTNYRERLLKLNSEGYSPSYQDLVR